MNFLLQRCAIGFNFIPDIMKEFCKSAYEPDEFMFLMYSAPYLDNEHVTNKHNACIINTCNVAGHQRCPFQLVNEMSASLDALLAIISYNQRPTKSIQQ